MDTRWIWLGLGMAVALVLPMAAASEDEEAEPERAPIREFEVETLAELGRAIYEHDQLAWKATDALMAAVDRRTLEKEGASGWVVDTTGKRPLVRFLRAAEDGDGVEAAYDVVFGKKSPKLGEPAERKLTERQRLSYLAYRAAIGYLTERESIWCGGSPNFVTLDDPDGVGFLVYVLRPKERMDEVPIGGHYRFTIGADGTEVEQVDVLFASCLMLSRKPEELPKGAELAALSMSHIVSDTPLETHVFLSLQEKLPFYVVVPDGQMWLVAEGRMEKR